MLHKTFSSRPRRNKGVGFFHSIHIRQAYNILSCTLNGNRTVLYENRSIFINNIAKNDDFMPISNIDLISSWDRTEIECTLKRKIRWNRFSERVCLDREKNVPLFWTRFSFFVYAPSILPRNHHVRFSAKRRNIFIFFLKIQTKTIINK